LDKKLHILFLNSWYPNRVLPNNGDFIQRHAEAVALTHKVTAIHVISDKKNQKKIEIVEKNINGVRTIIAYLKPTHNLIIKQYRYFLAYNKLVKLVKEFDLVHLNVIYPAGLMALYLKWFKKKPYLISEHWSDYQYPLNKNIGFIRKLFTKIIVRNANFVCPVSTHLRKAMIHFGLKGSYFPVPNVVDTNLFKPAKKANKNFVITHISNMDNTFKNITGILRVALNLQTVIPNFQINLIGGISKNYISDAKGIDNINFIKHIPHKSIASYLNNSDVLVLFSNYENLPCVILEAFACGTPVISTNVGGISEYFPENFGLLIKPNDESALEKAILNIYNFEKRTEKQVMHQYSEDNFSPNMINTTFTKLYQETLNLK